ncbi:hypothetical protein [Azospirillum sp. ST 5-10]|uniref:hypothetical protein n=1 Tax=unclassified Azospirillum TaxID=2630922 RepID=UPI003F4A1DD3
MIGNEGLLHRSAEVAALRRMLADIPEEDVIDRLSLEARLRVLEDQVEQERAAASAPAKARLTFRGSLERLSQDNLRETDEWLTGELLGVLPNRRTFEFQAAGRDDVVSGRIASSVGDARPLNRYLGRQSRTHVAVTRVGVGRPRYLLLAEPDVPEGEP